MDLLFCCVCIFVSPTTAGCVPPIQLQTHCFASGDVRTLPLASHVGMDVLSEKVSLDSALVVRGLAGPWLFQSVYQDRFLSTNLLQLACTTPHASLLAQICVVAWTGDPFAQVVLCFPFFLVQCKPCLCHWCCFVIHASSNRWYTPFPLPWHGRSMMYGFVGPTCPLDPFHLLSILSCGTSSSTSVDAPDDTSHMASTSHAALEGFAGAVAATTALAATYPLLTVRVVACVVSLGGENHRGCNHERNDAARRHLRHPCEFPRNRREQWRGTSLSNEKRERERMEGDVPPALATNDETVVTMEHNADEGGRTLTFARWTKPCVWNRMNSGRRESKPQGITNSTESIPIRDCH